MPAAGTTPSRSRPPRPRPSAASLSGDLTWLRVAGNRIVSSDGTPVVLRGVNLTDHETELDRLTAYLDWGANVVRVAIDRDRVLGASAALDDGYLGGLDAVIETAAQAGAYTIVSLRSLGELTAFGTLPDGSVNPVAPQPDADSIGMWRIVGERYEAEPAVLYDLFAAPHARLPDDLTGFDTSWALWSTWVQFMVAELRTAHPRALCIASGLDWGRDLSGFPVPGLNGDPLVNLAYGTVVAPGRGGDPAAVTLAARRLPMLVTEWTPGLSGQSIGSESTTARLAGAGIGWVAAGRLVREHQGQLVPTDAGMTVQRALARSPAPSVGTPPGGVQGWIADWRQSHGDR
jgi:hypothetical protein